jgi:hypothetical protein
MAMSESEKLEPFPSRNRSAARCFETARRMVAEAPIRHASKVTHKGLG